MVLPNDGRHEISAVPGRNSQPVPGNVRLARKWFDGNYRAGQVLDLHEVAAEHQLDEESILKTFAEFQKLGMVTLSRDFSAVVRSPDPKEMQEAYEIRAALEEISGRAAATVLKGKTDVLKNELDAMREAVRANDLDAYTEHDIKFHRIILQASKNEVLLQVWNTLAFDLRIRAAIAKVSKHLPEVVESHQSIVEALEKGRAREAGVLLRNHIETFLEFLKKAESDSGNYRALRKELQGAQDVQRAFFPARSLSIPCLSCETFYQPAHEIGGDYYDLISLQGGRWGIAIGDVSGKGIGAALIMASLQASLRAQALHQHLDLSALIGDVNRLVHESSPTDLFASLFYGEYEPAKRTLRYVNAGHNPPLVVRPRAGACEIFRLDSVAVPVGVSADTQYSSVTFRFEIGDVLVAYTDGITEVENAQRDQWGLSRLENLLRNRCLQSPEEIINCILEEVSTFANGQPQRDDATLVVMTVQPGCDV